MLCGRNILVDDYFYGNQLILWRSSIFIAIVLFLNFEGYTAFIIESSYQKSNVFLILTILLLIPINLMNDSDLILG